VSARKVGLAVSLAAASVLVVALGLRREPEPRAQGQAAAAANATSFAPSCRFAPGETAAFKLESTVRDVRGAEEDHFRGTLSWQVAEQLSATRWRLRAALSEVSRSEALTLPEERAQGPLTDPFFIDVDASCHFVGFGFVRDWDARRRQLVRSMLLTHEFVLPPATGARRWSASQSDGLGEFEASYAIVSRGRDPAWRIERRKRAYEGQASAAAMGLALVVLGSEATASFDPRHSHWLSRSSGLERVQIQVQGEVEADLLQRFSLTRDDSRFVAMRAVAVRDADFGDGFALEAEHAPVVDARTAQMSYKEALEAFLAQFGGTDDPSYAAARRLAGWLKTHPEAAPRLVAALRAGTIADAARPALFLGLELSGSDAARDALSDVLEDPHFRAVDRARAASALSDIGGPTRSTAELLLAQAQHDRSDMVANVSLLGLGSMARRSGDDEVRAYVRDSLDQELATAADETRTRVVLDAMGNSGDPAFVDELGAHLAAESAATRQHAAEALGHLDPAEAGPQLLARIGQETDPSVRAAMVAAYHGPPTAEAIALMSDKLTASASIPERAAIIKWLGSASRTEPDARERLVAHVHQETNARLVQQIGGFVPAAALR
jgi:hypothetical protein